MPTLEQEEKSLVYYVSSTVKLSPYHFVYFVSIARIQLSIVKLLSPPSMKKSNKRKEQFTSGTKTNSLTLPDVDNSHHLVQHDTSRTQGDIHLSQ